MQVIISQENHTLSLRSQLAVKDIMQGLKSWPIWLALAWQDIRLRYRRSALGPFWITLSMGITIGFTGLLYGTLFKMRLDNYFPFFSAGMLTWGLIAISLTEGSNIYFEGENFLKQMKLPFSAFILRTVCRNFIIFLHNIVIFIPIIWIFHIPVNWNTLISIYGMCLIVFNLVTISTLLAIFGTRFRDIGQIVTSLIQVVFFLTPIIWAPSILPEKYQFAIYLNPFAQFLEIVRAPLMGLMPTTYAFISTLVLTFLNATFAFIIFARFRARIAYWL
jgi:ABC-type polysaccharide/polyol phosphate export permease